MGVIRPAWPVNSVAAGDAEQILTRGGERGALGVGAFWKQGVGSVWLPAACYLLAHAKISLIRMAEPGGTKPA